MSTVYAPSRAVGHWGCIVLKQSAFLAGAHLALLNAEHAPGSGYTVDPLSLKIEQVSVTRPNTFPEAMVTITFQYKATS